MWESFHKLLEKYGSISGILSAVIKNRKERKEFSESIFQAGENQTKDNQKFLLEVFESETEFTCDAAKALVKYKDNVIQKKLIEYVENVEAFYGLRVCIIEALLTLTKNDNLELKLINIIKKELNLIPLNEDFFQELLDMFLITEVKPINFIKLIINDIILLLDMDIYDEIKITVLEIISFYKLKIGFPYILKFRHNEIFSEVAEKAIQNIGFEVLLTCLEKSDDKEFLLNGIELLIEKRQQINKNERVKDWDIKEEEVVKTLIKLSKINDDEVKLNTIRAISEYGNFAILAQTRLEEIIKNEKKELSSFANRIKLSILKDSKIGSNSQIAGLEKTKKQDIRNKQIYEIKIGILTAIDLESQAVIDVFGLEERSQGLLNFWEIDLPRKNQEEGYFKIIHLAGKKGKDIALDVIKIIDQEVDCLFLIGIAGGLISNSVMIGDILICSEVLDYDKTSEGKESKLKPKTININPEWLNHFYGFKKKNQKWKTTSKIQLDDKQIEILKEGGIDINLPQNVIIGKFFSGQKVIKTKEKVDEILAKCVIPDDFENFIGIEMETCTVVPTCIRKNPSLPIAIIKGVSDLPELHKSEEEIWDKFHKMAAYSSAYFLKDFLERGGLSPHVFKRDNDIKEIQITDKNMNTDSYESLRIIANQIVSSLPLNFKGQITEMKSFFDYYFGLEILIDGRSIKETIKYFQIYICEFDGNLEKDDITFKDSDLLEKIYPEKYCSIDISNWKAFIDLFLKNGWKLVCLNGIHSKYLYLKSCLIKDEIVIILKHQKNAQTHSGISRSKSKYDYPIKDDDLIKF